MHKDFLKKRLAQENEHFKNITEKNSALNSLVVIEINLTELCNRKCVFCPKSDPKIAGLYPAWHVRGGEDSSRLSASQA